MRGFINDVLYTLRMLTLAVLLAGFLIGSIVAFVLVCLWILAK